MRVLPTAPPNSSIVTHEEINRCDGTHDSAVQAGQRHAYHHSRATALADRLRERIKRGGAITFHDWMQAALYDEREGYYRGAGRPRQGRAGDYRTAPETSPLFGATFAHYFAKCYIELGAPQVFIIAEIGAGRGDFACAVLSTLQRDFPDVFARTVYFIDEISDHERPGIESKLSSFAPRVEFSVTSNFADNLDAAIVFSNELLDAFPVHRVVGRGRGLRELFVAVDERGDFIWQEFDLTPEVAEYCRQIKLQLPEGRIFEVNLAAKEFIARAASYCRQGFLITVDYGTERRDLLDDPHYFGGSLRAFHRHRFIDDVLSHAGEVDLTTTVDWTQIKEAGTRRGFKTLRFQRLDRFLLDEEILSQLSQMTVEMSDAGEVARLTAGARELIMPDRLAAHFQVLVQRRER